MERPLDKSRLYSTSNVFGEYSECPVTKISLPPRAGDIVKAGDVLVILEAMKMEIEVSAPVDGTVKSVAAVQGTAVNTDDLLVTLG